MRISDWSSDVCSSDLAAVRDPCGGIGGIEGCGHGRRFKRRDEVRRGRWMAGAARGGCVRRSGLEPAARSSIPNSCALRYGRLGPGPGESKSRGRGRRDRAKAGPTAFRREARSEEHTSELQSLMRISYAVFCLKKKKQTKRMNNQTK